MSIEFEIKLDVVMHHSHEHSDDEYCAILDALIATMNQRQLKHWVKKSNYVWAMQDAMREVMEK